MVDQILGMEGIEGEGRNGYRSDNAWFGECRVGVYNVVSQLEGKEGG